MSTDINSEVRLVQQKSWGIWPGIWGPLRAIATGESAQKSRLERVYNFVWQRSANSIVSGASALHRTKLAANSKLIPSVISSGHVNSTRAECDCIE